MVLVIVALAMLCRSCAFPFGSSSKDRALTVNASCLRAGGPSVFCNCAAVRANSRHARRLLLARGPDAGVLCEGSDIQCLRVQVPRFIDFHDLQIIDCDPRALTFTARVVKTLSERFPVNVVLRGQFEVDVPWIHTGVVLAAQG